MILYDPGTIGLLIGSFIASGGVAAIPTWIGWGLIVGITAYGAINQRRQLRHQQADAKAAYNASLSDRTATLLQAAPPWRIVYGRCVVGSDIVAMFTSDKTGYREDGTTYTRYDAYKHLVMHIASHQVQAIHEVFINGIPLGPLDSNGIPTLTNDFHRTDSFGYTVTIGGGGTVDVAPPAASILQASTGAITVQTDNFQDVTGSCSITNGGNTITGPAGASVTYMANVSHWAVRAQLHLGTASQTVDTYLNSVVPSQWTSNHRLRGRAYAVITLDLEDPRFQGGPPGITFDVSGRLLTHPTTGQTVAHDNAALVIQDFLQQKWGYNTSSTSLVTNSWNTAIADCDARLDGTGQDAYDVAFTVDTGQNVILLTEERALNVGDGVRFTTTNTLPAPLATGTTYYISRKDDDTARAQDRKHFALATSVTNARAGTYIDITSAGSGTHTLTLYDYPAYTINGMFVTSESREGLLEEFARAMAGTVTNIGRWYAFAGTWHTSVMDLDDDDLDGAISLPSADTDLEGLINGQRGQFIPAGSGTPIEYDPYQNATFRTADGEDLYDDFNYRWTNTRYRCRNLSRIRTEQIRSGQQLTIPAKLTALPLQPGDRIRVTSSELAITNKYYRVTDTQFGYTSPMVLSVIEDDSTIWDLADAATADPTPNSGLPSRTVSQVTLTPAPYADTTTGVYTSAGAWVPRIKVSWSAITDPYMGDSNARVWVGWRLAYDTTYQWTAVPPDQRYVYLSGFPEGLAVIVQVYAQNHMGDKGPPAYAAVTVAVTGQGEIGGGNLLRNSSFEVDSNGDGLADNWSISGSGSYGATGNASEPNPIHGANAQRIAATNLGTTSSDLVELAQGVALPNIAGKPVVLSVYAHDSGASGTPDLSLNLDWYTSIGGTYVTSDSVNFDSPGSSFARYLLAGRVPASANAVVVRLRMQSRTGSAGAASMDFDAAQLEVGAVPTAYAPRADELLPGVITDVMLSAALAADLDGKIVSYWQTTAPGTATEGDLWYDTDDNYKVYRWTSGAWVLAADSRIATAISNAATAQSTADGKVVTFVQTSIPTSEGVGDLWFDSDDGYKMYRAQSAGADQITAGEWVAYQFGTSAIGTGAATVASFSSGSGTTSGLHTSATDATATVLTDSYENTTGRTVIAQAEAGCQELYIYGTPIASNFTVADVNLVVGGAVSGNGTYRILDLLSDVPSVGNYHGVTRAYQFEVASGSTLTLDLKFHSTLYAANAIYGMNGQATLRRTIIKA